MITSRNIKYLKSNVTKQMKELCNENYSTLETEIEEGIGKWKDVPFSWVCITNIVKMSIQPKMTDLMQSQWFLQHFHRTRKTNPKIYREPEEIKS